jgi:hypothetical protein
LHLPSLNVTLFSFFGLCHKSKKQLAL